MFRSTFEHTIDEKGRVIIPTKFREELGARFFAARGPENCIYLYPCAEWEKIESQLCALVTTKPKERAFVRLMMSSVADCETNAQGRVTLPPHLRGHARLRKNVVLFGALTHVEVWDSELWAAYCEENGTVEQLGTDLEIRF
ncbi:MAG: division/cell wall cluster transcriptional repressor MraZ [Gracilibacteraceae bacterium]|jgi:MraZ protein|nr:division/cell wall cluster transcriptional repressor MraZ [Gracilibacteraceae bacterium]